MNTKAELFKTASCPDAALLFKYSKGDHHGLDVHHVEQHLITCTLCNDAVEGMQQLESRKSMKEVKNKNPFRSNNFGWWFSGMGILVIVVISQLYTPSERTTLTKEEQKAIYREEFPTITKPESSFADTVAEQNEKVVLNTLPVNADTSHQEQIEEPERIITAAIDSVDNVYAKPAERIIEPRFAMPVKYLYDLKVIDYSEVYERIDKKGKAILKGVPANREGKINDNLPVVENDTVTSEMLLNECMLNFNTGNYRKAIDNFNKLLNVFPDDLNALFYSGVSYYKLGKYDNALNNLQKVLAHRNNVFTEEAEWYLALSLINNENRNEAMIVLQRIVNQKGFYSEKASAKLKSIQ